MSACGGGVLFRLGMHVVSAPLNRSVKLEVGGMKLSKLGALE